LISFNLRASVGRVFNAVNAARLIQTIVLDSLRKHPTSVLDTDFTTTSNVVLSDLYVENASF
jgi:iron complex outermembrane receptor protein